MAALSKQLKEIAAKAKRNLSEAARLQREQQQAAFDTAMRAQQITKAAELVSKIPDLLREQAGLGRNKYPLRDSGMVAWHPDAVTIVTSFLNEEELTYIVTDRMHEFDFWKEYTVTW